MSLPNFWGCPTQTLSCCEGLQSLPICTVCACSRWLNQIVLRTSVSKHYISLQYISWCLQDACASGTSAGIGMASWISHGWRDSKWLCVCVCVCMCMCLCGPTACWYEWTETDLAPAPSMLTSWPFLTECGWQRFADRFCTVPHPAHAESNSQTSLSKEQILLFKDKKLLFNL